MDLLQVEKKRKLTSKVWDHFECITKGESLYLSFHNFFGIFSVLKTGLSLARIIFSAVLVWVGFCSFLFFFSYFHCNQGTSLPLPTTGKDFNFHLIKPTGLLVGTQGTPVGFLFGMDQQAAYGLPKPDLVLGRSAIWLISAQPKPPNYVPGSAGLAHGQPKPAQLATLCNIKT
jgi:hypothetical protein